MQTAALISEGVSVMEKPQPVEPLATLEERLLELFNDPTVEQDELEQGVSAMLSNYSQTSKDWQKYCFFSDLHYTRNLVSTNGKFEMIIVCWKAGQMSRIHNHAGSNCWLGVLQGAAVERLYTKVQDGQIICEQRFPSQPGCCPDLRLEKTTVIQPGEVGYIHDRMGLHSIAAPPSADSVSLHIYSPPISVATLFDPDINSVVQRTPGFYSVGGKRLC